MLIALSGPNTRIGAKFSIEAYKGYPRLCLIWLISLRQSQLQDISPDDVEFEIYPSANRMIAPIGDKIQGVQELCVRSIYTRSNRSSHVSS